MSSMSHLGCGDSPCAPCQRSTIAPSILANERETWKTMLERVFRVVQSEIARMETILGEYLSFSRPLEDLKPEPIALDGVVRDAAAVVAGRAEHHGLALEVETQAVTLTADARRLKARASTSRSGANAGSRRRCSTSWPTRSRRRPAAAPSACAPARTVTAAA